MNSDRTPLTAEQVDRAARALYEWEWDAPAPSGYNGEERLRWAEKIVRAALDEDDAHCHWDDCPHGAECVHAKPGASREVRQDG